METKKRKAVLWVVAGVIAAVAVLGAIYSYLAFMPTGYENFRPQGDAARERLARLARPRVDFREGVTTATRSQTEARDATPPATPPPEVDFLKAVTDFNSAEALRQDHPLLALVPVYPHPLVFGTNWLKPNAPEPGRPIWPGLEPEHRDYMLRYIPASLHPVEWPVATVGQIERFLGRLDEVENFLLRRQWTISRQGAFYRHEEHEIFARLALYAIARVSLHRDQERAMRLLERFLEAERLIRLFDHDGDDGWESSDDVAVVLFGLADLPDFPEQGWERARAELERMRLSEAELADLRRARASLYHDLMVERLRGQNLGHMENFWHFFYKGKVEAAANRMIEPIALRRLEALSLAMGGDDDAKYNGMRANFYGTLSYMNVGGLVREDSPEFYRVEHQFNDKVDRALLLLEATRARRDGKPLAAPIAIGTPARLHLETITVPRSGIFRLDSDMSPAEIQRFNNAVAQYEIAHPGRGVVWADDVEAVLKALGPRDWGKYVQWQEVHPTYALWSLGHTWNRNIYEQDRATPPYRQAPAIKLQTVAIRLPLLGDEMKRILMAGRDKTQ